jgi:hypothetical protein
MITFDTALNSGVNGVRLTDGVKFSLAVLNLR